MWLLRRPAHVRFAMTMPLRTARAEKRLEFERRRKLHYNEFEAVRRARQLMEQDELDDEIIDMDEAHAAS